LYVREGHYLTGSYFVPANVPTPLSQFPTITSRDPAGLVPLSALKPLTTYVEATADLLGNYTGFTTGVRPLNAAATAGVTSLGTLLSMVLTGTDAYPMVLGASTAATQVPLVVQPSDYNGSTNMVAYSLQNWHAKGLYVEGISGFGLLSLPPQVVTPGPVSTVQVFANSSYALVVQGPNGSVTIPTSGYAPTTFLQRNGIWASAVSGPYTPGNPSAWSGAAPTTIQQALDRIAAVCPSKP